MTPCRFLTATVLLVSVWLGGCASLPAPVPVPPTQAFVDVAATPLARIAAASTPPGNAALSGFRLLPEARFAFDARAALARRARKSLDVQYYVIQNDLAGRQFLGELRDAAARGVRVRLLVDDFHTDGADELFSTLAAFPNVEVRLFNPLPVRGESLATRLLFSLSEISRINHRMHNKLFIADNTFSVSGGRNIADEYFMRSEAANFIDLDVLASGPAVREQSKVFDVYWNSEQVWPIERLVRPAVAPDVAQKRFDALADSRVAELPSGVISILGRGAVSEQLAAGRVNQIWAPAEVLADSPLKITRASDEARYAGSVTEHTLALMAMARFKVQIASPYFIPGKAGLAILRGARAQGVQVTVLTNSLAASDEPLVYLGYARYRKDMLKLGVEIYELSPTLARRAGTFGDFHDSIGRLHAKTATVDARWLYIGSMNLDSRSARLNTETGLIIDSPELADDLEKLVNVDNYRSAYRLRLDRGGRIEWFAYDAAGQLTVSHDEPDTNWFVEIKNWAMSWLVDEALL